MDELRSGETFGSLDRGTESLHGLRESAPAFLQAQNALGIKSVEDGGRQNAANECVCSNVVRYDETSASDGPTLPESPALSSI